MVLHRSSYGGRIRLALSPFLATRREWEKQERSRQRRHGVRRRSQRSTARARCQSARASARRDDAPGWRVIPHICATDKIIGSLPRQIQTRISLSRVCWITCSEWFVVAAHVGHARSSQLIFCQLLHGGTAEIRCRNIPPKCIMWRSGKCHLVREHRRGSAIGGASLPRAPRCRDCLFWF